MSALPRMKNFPGSERLKREGGDRFTNIATLLGKLEGQHASSEYSNRPALWKQLVRDLAAYLKNRFDLRNAPQSKRKYAFGYGDFPEWQDYMRAGYDSRMLW